MDFESAKGFAERQRQINQGVETYQPSVARPEHLSANERFNILWSKVDALIDLAPPGGTYRVDENTVRTEGKEGLRVTISRETDPCVAGSLRPEIKTIRAQWDLEGNPFINEVVSDGVIAFHDESDEIHRRIGIVEESIEAAETLTRELVERMEAFDRIHHGIPGHP